MSGLRNNDFVQQCIQELTSVVDDDSCGVHSRPYHSCVIACVMQVREEHAIGA